MLLVVFVEQAIKLLSQNMRQDRKRGTKMKKYKIWVTVEEIDENLDHYQDVTEPISVGEEFATRLEAVEYIESMMETNGTVD